MVCVPIDQVTRGIHHAGILIDLEYPCLIFPDVKCQLSIQTFIFVPGQNLKHWDIQARVCRLQDFNVVRSLVKHRSIIIVIDDLHIHTSLISQRWITLVGYCHLKINNNSTLRKLNFNILVVKIIHFIKAIYNNMPTFQCYS